MDRELDRHAEGLFGDRVMRRKQAGSGPPSALPSGSTAAASDGSPIPQEGDADAGSPADAPAVKTPLTARQQSRLWRHVEQTDRFWEGLPEIEPGSVARLGQLAAERRWEVIFLTKRPPSAGPTAQVQTQRWLEAHGFPLPSVFVVQGSRGKIAASLDLDLVVDDRPENCLDVAIESKARALLVWRDDIKHVPAATRRLGIGVVASVGECLDILTQIDHAPEGRSGIVERLIRLMGFKKAPAGS